MLFFFKQVPNCAFIGRLQWQLLFSQPIQQGDILVRQFLATRK